MTKIKRTDQVTDRTKRHHPRPMVTGSKLREKLRPAVSNVRIFATKFHPEETEMEVKAFVEEVIGDDCRVEQISARTSMHSSFIITASKRHEEILLDPSSWKEGVQVRHFYGRLKSNVDRNLR